MSNRFKAAVSAFRNPDRCVVTLPIITMTDDRDINLENDAIQRFTEAYGRPPYNRDEAFLWAWFRASTKEGVV